MSRFRSPSGLPESAPRRDARSYPVRPVLGTLLAAVALVGLVSPSDAQVEPELLRFDWSTGILLTGEIASSDFVLDSSPFGGQRTSREGGSLDVDPALLFGLETTLRLTDHFSVSGSWMHSSGRFRVTYPALSSAQGDFDLEGLILAGQDFTNLGSDYRASSAMSLALTDVFLASVTWEAPVLQRWAFPYLTVGAGMYRLRSDGLVIQLDWDGEVPPAFEQLAVLGVDPLASSGIARIYVDATDPVVQVGGGLRASISQRWGLDVMFEDLIRLGVDGATLTGSTPDADPEQGRLFQTVFRGKDGTVHNLGIRFALNYAFWPRYRPR